MDINKKSNKNINRKIHMTYFKNIPKHVIHRWQKLNPKYRIKFNFDKDCEEFIRRNFNEDVLELFCKIPEGKYKADLWRLCKLYKEGGVYADVDLYPYLKIDDLPKDISFYSVLASDDNTINSIFQAFIVNFGLPENKLILCFLLSFLINKPYNKLNGPTVDMYNVLNYNIDETIRTCKKINIINPKVQIKIPNFDNNEIIIDLIWFPKNIDYKLKIHEKELRCLFNIKILKNKLYIKNKDNVHKVKSLFHVNIYFNSNENIYLFEERINNIDDENYKGADMYVFDKNKKILKSRMTEYLLNDGW